MQPDESDELLTALFRRLRAAGMPLGIAELLAAQRALAAGFGDDRRGGDAALKRMLQLLWCKSAAHNAELDVRMDELLAVRRAGQADEQRSPADEAQEAVPPPSHEPGAEQRPAVPEPVAQSRPAPSLMPLPVRAPESPPPPADDALLIAAAPVSRRSMAYSWRHLRRPVKDGPCDRLNLSATVERAARQGFFDRPVLDRRESDHAHLVLLLDQGGSMTPFHRLTRELVDTVGDAGLGQLAIGYFQNTPPEQVYRDPHRTDPVPLSRLLADCGSESSVLIVSDAGAARGGRAQQRFRATARAVVDIRRHTARLAWLNPVPAARWPGTTAQLIAAIVPMQPMDEDGFSNTVDLLRGLAIGAAT